ncbi:MAG: hypothetical protein CMJ49_00705 [Planctomycetaceae bacterium]|nr:hypothetical protein [Planctomycetaceae bacterium]
MSSIAPAPHMNLASPAHADSHAASAATACDGVVCFGGIDWWYHNRGHAQTRIAMRFAQRARTVWVNSIAMRMPVPGKTDLAWTRYLRKARSLLKGLQYDADADMWVYSPWFIPRYTPAMLEFNGWLMSMQVRAVTDYLNIRRPSTWVSIPTAVPAVERLNWHSIVFDRCDDFTTLPGADAQLIGALEQRMLDVCDHAAYVNDELFQREKNRVKHAEFIGHGVDFDHFVACRPTQGPRTDVPPAMRDLPRPIVGFYGGMDDYRMDRDLMIKIARHVHAKGGTMILIGPDQMDLSKVRAEPNVVHIDQLPPDDLARHAAHYDVGIIPFYQNEFNVRCNPTKLKEYLALGYPIVAMKLPAFDPYDDLIIAVDSHEEFLAGIDTALTETGDEMTERRRAAVSGSSWDVVAHKVAKMLGTPN